ncbi:MAG: carboxypeptidase regulatory-like domain-containing protein, partial [Nitrososphaerota archaeon]|nr:carboxypeptidase regulatory-like domain-containing protein [Nitrososphaerota archaeon]
MNEVRIVKRFAQILTRIHSRSEATEPDPHMPLVRFSTKRQNYKGGSRGDRYEANLSERWSRRAQSFDFGTLLRVTVVALMTVVWIGGNPARAQFLSGIEGTVTDSTGAAIPGAKITITNTKLGVTQSATSNGAGYFHFSSIAASTYNILIQKTGFQTWRQENLVVQVGQTRTIAPTLKVGTVAQQVTVSATAASINLTSPRTGAIISSRTVRSTPLTGQNVYALAALSPGMTGSAVNSADNYTNEY